MQTDVGMISAISHGHTAKVAGADPGSYGSHERLQFTDNILPTASLLDFSAETPPPQNPLATEENRTSSGASEPEDMFFRKESLSSPPPSYRDSIRLEAQLTCEQQLEIQVKELERLLHKLHETESALAFRKTSLDDRERLIRQQEENNIELAVHNEIYRDYR